ncbi:uncharacterized protein SCHCODRAFT_01187097 [Schizophyllum commune H4-8]|uniref:Uncharacterized protein n=1 Tax=Schizophyllum commune (strain H4-8 / FGSC 9210) TaxID=578458 RepID=D8PWI8_SCHCM|nr:uncharacterized protein SCHCODRAFT_01187097 [Schizophyllum commune H4-8]KAI5899934.1 hypothetical protein SCHCODRAFT_01187097 [Schizophyllum commune H4-8]
MPRPFSMNVNEGEARGAMGSRPRPRSGRPTDQKDKRARKFSFASLLGTSSKVDEEQNDVPSKLIHDEAPTSPGGAPAAGSPRSGPDDADMRSEDKEVAGPAALAPPATPTTHAPRRSPSMLRRLSMRLRASSPSAQVSSPTAEQPMQYIDDPFRAERPAPRLPRRRISALRARGLEPPVRDLSALERERDERLPVLQPVGEEEDGEATAARRIREEWLARNALRVDTDAAEPVDIESVDPCTVPLPPSPAPSVKAMEASTSSPAMRRGSLASSERAPALDTDSRSSLASSSPRSEASWRARERVERSTPGVLESPVEGSVVLPPLLEETIVEEPTQEGDEACPPPSPCADKASKKQKRLSLFGWPRPSAPSPSTSNRRSGLWDMPSPTSSKRRSGTWDGPRTSSAPITTRLPVAPVMHDVKTISTKMDSIEDEETRRMTEVAFM